MDTRYSDTLATMTSCRTLAAVTWPASLSSRLPLLSILRLYLAWRTLRLSAATASSCPVPREEAADSIPSLSPLHPLSTAALPYLGQSKCSCLLTAVQVSNASQNAFPPQSDPQTQTCLSRGPRFALPDVHPQGSREVHTGTQVVPTQTRRDPRGLGYAQLGSPFQSERKCRESIAGPQIIPFGPRDPLGNELELCSGNPAPLKACHFCLEGPRHEALEHSACQGPRRPSPKSQGAPLD